ncbi:MAG: hypothetical protein Tsb005_15540 [Gammaproteobacteria bacterium]
MRRTLISVSLDWTRPKDPPISLGQASILANLRYHKINTINKAWSVNHANFDIKKVERFVMSHATRHTDLALGAYVWHEPSTQSLLNNLRQQNFPGRIILGGPQVSYTKRSIEDYYPQADIFIRGYAENALAKLLTSHEQRPVIAGIHYAGEPDLGLSAKAELNKLPSPFLTGIIKSQKFLRIETQRGCPFYCNFCQHSRPDIDIQRQYFPHSRIMEEARWITNNPIIQDIAVVDPTFNSGPHYIEFLEQLIVGKYSGKIALQCRAEMVRPEFLDVVERLNKTAHVVLEFGLQSIHKREQQAIERPNNMKKINFVLEETKRRKIATEVSLIFGLPHQTLMSFQQSVDYCKDLGVPTIYAFPLMLLRGTPLHDQKQQLGLIESTDNPELAIDRIQQHIPHVIASPSFSYEDWRQMAKIAESLDSYNANQGYKKQSQAKMFQTLKHTFWNDNAIRKEDDSNINNLLTNKMTKHT